MAVGLTQRNWFEELPEVGHWAKDIVARIRHEEEAIRGYRAAIKNCEQDIAELRAKAQATAERYYSADEIAAAKSLVARQRAELAAAVEQHHRVRAYGRS
jgi:hypothetical protein